MIQVMLSRLNLRTRFALGHALVIMVAMLITGFLALHQLSRDSARQLEESLTHKSRLLEELVSPTLAQGDMASLRNYLRQLDQAVGARLTIIDPDGQVLSDSRRRAEGLDNHGQRPEILAARNTSSGLGTATRYSTSVRHEMIYVARSLHHHDLHLGYLRIAYPLTNLTERRHELLRSLLLAGLLGVTVAIGLGIYSAGRISRPLGEITEAATAYSAGNLGRRIPMNAHPGDAFAVLSRTFNSLAAELESRLGIITDERNRLHAVLSGLSEGVVAVDSRGYVMLLNQPAANLLGIKYPAVQAPLWDICRHPEILEVSQQVLANGQRQQRTITVYHRQRPNQEVTVDLHAATFSDDSGKPIGAVLVLHDISERRLLETMRRDFVANVSHELKTPLAAIRGLVETLDDDPEMPAATRQRFIAKVHDQCLRLSSIVMDLLTLSRAEARHDQNDREPVDMAALIRMSTKQMEAHAGSKNISLILEEPSKALSLWVRGDAELLRQAIDNLIDNAIKYTPAGGQVVIRLQQEDMLLRCQVRDTGIGIPKQYLERIWERFYRVDKARSREVGGTGLGLSIVRNVISSHGGSVQVTSEQDRGSIFTVDLPLITDPTAHRA
ncbi:MAG: HAMP domain-containing protein [Planctomycetota bacterium]|nr:MAG: HAMP domain-containing protein [Planctomycetota bacterium]